MKKITGFCLLLFAIISCNETGLQQYEKLKDQELASGKRADSLFFGIYFGMTSKDFYLHCWQLNKRGIFTDGSNNTMVLYRLNHNELPYPASMNFYPDFYQDKVYKMRAVFQYDGWAPWNRNLFADSLMAQVVKLYTAWYAKGNAFIKIDDKKWGTIYVKADANRRIIIGKNGDSKVNVDYTDLLAEEKMNK